MIHRTSSKTPSIGCYLVMILFMLLGSAIFKYFQKDSIFPENSISYPPPSSVGCKTWNSQDPYLNRFFYVPDAIDATQAQLAIFASDDLAIYSLAERKFVRCLSFRMNTWKELSPNGKLLALSGPIGQVKIRQMDSNVILATLYTDDKRVMDMEFSPDSQTLAFLMGDSLRLWDATRPTQPHRELVNHVGFQPFTFSTTGKTFVVASYNEIRQWNTQDWSEKPALPEPTWFKRATELFYTKDDRSLILLKSEGFTVIDPTNGNEIYRWVEYVGSPQEYVNGNALSPDGHYLALIGHRFTNGYYGPGQVRQPTTTSQLHLWRTDSWEYLGQITGEWGNSPVFSPDSRTLAVNWDGKIRFMPMDQLIPILKMLEE